MYGYSSCFWGCVDCFFRSFLYRCVCSLNRIAFLQSYHLTSGGNMTLAELNTFLVLMVCVIVCSWIGAKWYGFIGFLLGGLIGGGSYAFLVVSSLFLYQTLEKYRSRQKHMDKFSMCFCLLQCL